MHPINSFNFPLAPPPAKVTIQVRWSKDRTNPHAKNLDPSIACAVLCGPAGRCGGRSILCPEQQGREAKGSADNAWMLVSSALVLMMTGPGLALFYGGLVRKKNVLATMMQ